MDSTLEEPSTIPPGFNVYQSLSKALKLDEAMKYRLRHYMIIINCIGMSEEQLNEIKEYRDSLPSTLLCIFDGDAHPFTADMAMLPQEYYRSLVKALLASDSETLYRQYLLAYYIWINSTLRAILPKEPLRLIVQASRNADLHNNQGSNPNATVEMVNTWRSTFQSLEKIVPAWKFEMPDVCETGITESDLLCYSTQSTYCNLVYDHHGDLHKPMRYLNTEN